MVSQRLIKQLKAHLKGKIIILGIGNTLRRDDGFGVHLVRQLKGNKNIQVIDGGSSPENYLGSIVKKRPDIILLVDAASFSPNPGIIKLFKASEVKTRHLFTTHNISCQLLINFLQEQIKTKLLFLAVQPKDTGFGEGLSKELKRTLEVLKKVLSRIL